jgi:hypothetical protein
MLEFAFSNLSVNKFNFTVFKVSWFCRVDQPYFQTYPLEKIMSRTAL